MDFVIESYVYIYRYKVGFRENVGFKYVLDVKVMRGRFLLVGVIFFINRW